MLRVCALQYGRSWNKSLSYTEFSDNNISLETGRWHHLRCYMVVGAETHCFGMRLENRSFWTWHITGRRETSSHGERQPKDCLVKTEVLHWPEEKRIEFWSWRFHVPHDVHLWEVYDISRYESSSHLGSLVLSRSWKREKVKWRQNSRISFLIHPNLRARFIYGR
jgi:hypothetical protein